MKKGLMIVIMTCISLGAFAQSGIIREISGTVEIKASGTASFVSANTGDRINEDTVISTSFKSTALVEVGSVLIAVRPLTRLTLSRYP